MTQPHVTDGTFKRIGVVPTPWPSFSVVASDEFVAREPGLAVAISEVARGRAAALEIDESLGQRIVDRYNLEVESALEWVDGIDWTSPDATLDPAMIEAVTERMRSVGRIAR